MSRFRFFPKRFSNVRRLRRMGDAAGVRRDWAAARKAYTSYLEKNERDAEIWVQLGHASKELGEFREAQTAYCRAIEVAPAEAGDAHFHLAGLLKTLGDDNGAVFHYAASAALGWDVSIREVERLKRLSTGSKVGSGDVPDGPQFSSVHHAWIGRASMDGMNTLDLLSMNNFRAAGPQHGRYSVVWLYELLLSDYYPSQWRLILDEALRLLGRRGTLKIRHAQNENISLIALRSYLARRPGMSVTMPPSDFIEGGLVEATFEIERQAYEVYQDRSWSFVILAQGSRTDNLLKMVERVNRLAVNLEHEIIVVGPSLPQYRDTGIFVFDKEYPNNHPQIALKKNEAAQFAQYANLCFMHDRYYIADDFFSGFERFGYDFDFVGVNQRYETGEPYPFLGELTGPPLIWSVPRHSTNYQHARPTHFVNGGMMVFKRETFSKIQYNPLLAWNEGEDVEISHQFLVSCLPPRLNLHSTAITSVPSSHTAVFLNDVRDGDLVAQHEEHRSRER